MDLLQDAGSSDEDEVQLPLQPVARPANRAHLNAAPTPSLLAGRKKETPTTPQTALALVAPKAKSATLSLMNNPTKATLYQPIHGPQVDDPQRASKRKPGTAEANVHFDETTFTEQRTSFQRTGQALGPDHEGAVITRTTLGYSEDRLKAFEAEEEKRQSRKRAREEASDEKDVLVEGSDDEVQYGIWGPSSNEERWEKENALSDIAKGGKESLAPEQLAEREHLKERARQRGLEETQNEEATESSFDRMVERKMSHLLPPRLGENQDACEASTKFHGTEEYDYRGRSWVAPPGGLGSIRAEDLGLDHHKCFVPKKCVHRFLGHNKGVHRIRLFPNTGHLLLSGGLDGKCKVWSVETKKVMRTYIGHTAAVRDVQFNNDGSKFVSCSFDRYLRLWNTETGSVLGTYTNRRVPYVVKFYPHDDNFFVVGCSDNKIVTYDSTSGEVTQEYNHHLGPINSILFVEDHGTKMITTSDDKKVLVWEWDIGVPIKYISDPTMHSMPCTVLHPAGQYFCAQSLDNTITVFQARDRFALQRKKKYSGHQVAGYACQMDISPDGQFLTSGDGNGKLFFWDWKRHKMLQKYRAHDDGPTIACVWHPLEPATVFTCGWDGVIKMWQ